MPLHQLRAQDNDSIKNEAPVKKKDRSPRKAAMRSAIIPGWGQLYNKKYWKLSVLYAGMGINTFFYFRNQKLYHNTRDLLDAYPNKNDAGDRLASRLRNNIDTYRSWRDWNYVIFAGIYLLNIVDANVDAHLKEFDVGENLSFHIKPYLCPGLFSNPAAGLTFNFRFKN
ncbi:MAG: hypothetical protein K2X86_12805 [Cytophagaceae bacterium]|nr:hypothetical protein [Cytophagaceae bacterium]